MPIRQVYTVLFRQTKCRIFPISFFLLLPLNCGSASAYALVTLPSGITSTPFAAHHVLFFFFSYVCFFFETATPSFLSSFYTARFHPISLDSHLPMFHSPFHICLYCVQLQRCTLISPSFCVASDEAEVSHKQTSFQSLRDNLLYDFRRLTHFLQRACGPIRFVLTLQR